MLAPVCAGMAVLAVALYIVHALELVGFPHDWESGEGLSLNYARRLLDNPASLYPRERAVPFPLVYTPLMPALLAPLTVLGQPLAAARVVALAWTLAIVAAVYVLVRRRASRPLALVSAALVLAPAQGTFWFAMVRVDGLMIALWLWGAVLVMPERLASGSGRLSWARAWAGAGLLVAAVLAKPIAVVYGAPLVLGWLLVERRSAVRLGIASLVAGAGCFALLQLGTGGGFWRCQMLQTLFPRQPGQMAEYLRLGLATYAAPVVLGVLALGAAVAVRRAGVLREGALLLWLAGPLTVPFLSKYGAALNYLLPWLAAQAVLFGRWLGEARPDTGRPAQLDRGGCLAGALAIAYLTATQSFPVPTALDRATADAFYGFLKRRGAPILAVRPDMAYEVVGQDAEVEWASFPHLARARLPGTEEISRRMGRAEYRVLVDADRGWKLVAPAYRPTGLCALGSAIGEVRLRIMVPIRDGAAASFTPPRGTRCVAPRLP